MVFLVLVQLMLPFLFYEINEEHFKIEKTQERLKKKYFVSRKSRYREKMTLDEELDGNPKMGNRNCKIREMNRTMKMEDK